MYMYVVTVAILLLLGNRPTKLYLQRLFIERYANHWNEIGLELHVNDSRLEIIRENYATHHNKTEECCRAMVKEWLKVDNNATWENLFKAIEAVTQASPTSGEEKFGKYIVWRKLTSNYTLRMIHVI